MHSRERFTVSVVKSASQTPYDEHKVTVKDNVTECYIESTVDERFEIHIKASNEPELWRQKEAFGLFIYIDGRYCDGKLMGTVGNQLFHEAHSVGKRQEGSSYSAYIFTKTEFSGITPS